MPAWSTNSKSSSPAAKLPVIATLAVSILVSSTSLAERLSVTAIGAPFSV